MRSRESKLLALAAAILAGCGFRGAPGGPGGDDDLDGGGDADLDASGLETLVLRRDLGAAVFDTWLFEDAPDEVRGGRPDFNWDADRVEMQGSLNGESAALLIFDFIGAGADRVPPGSSIESAELQLYLLNGGNEGELCDMRVDWTEQTTWSSFGDEGPVLDDDYRAAPVALVPGTANAEVGATTVDVTAGVASWVAGDRENRGWLIRTNGTDGVRAASSEEQSDVERRPTLTIQFRRP